MAANLEHSPQMNPEIGSGHGGDGINLGHEHMADIGMTFEPEACHYERTIGNAKLRLGGYAVSEDADQLDLFVSLYEGVETVTPVSDTETKTAAERWTSRTTPTGWRIPSMRATRRLTRFASMS